MVVDELLLNTHVSVGGVAGRVRVRAGRQLLARILKAQSGQYNYSLPSIWFDSKFPVKAQVHVKSAIFFSN
jgi:hypothetical protein